MIRSQWPKLCLWASGSCQPSEIKIYIISQFKTSGSVEVVIKLGATALWTTKNCHYGQEFEGRALSTCYLCAPSQLALEGLAVSVSLFVSPTLSNFTKRGMERWAWVCDVLMLWWTSREGPKQTLNQLWVVNIQNSESRPKKYLMTAIHRIPPAWQQGGLLLQQGMAASRPAGGKMFLTQWNFRSVVAKNLSSYTAYCAWSAYIGIFHFRVSWKWFPPVLSKDCML